MPVAKNDKNSRHKTHVQSKSSVKNLKNDRSIQSLGKHSKSKSGKSVSNNSRKSVPSCLNKCKGSKKQRTKNFTTTNVESFLFKDASKSSIPISQGFFDNLGSPCSNQAFHAGAVEGQIKPGRNEPRVTLRTETDAKLQKQNTNSK